MENPIIMTGLAFIVTVLTSLFKKSNLSDKQKNIIASALSIFAGTSSVLIQGVDLSFGNIVSTAISIYGASQIAYSFILKGTKLDKVLTNTVLFGSASDEVSKTLEVAEAVEELASKTAKPVAKKTVARKTTAKKTAAKKPSDSTANANRKKL